MPELRTDRLAGRAVLVAEKRAERPDEFRELASGEPASAGGNLGQNVTLHHPLAEAGSPSAPVCPFCPGQEQLTPPAVYEVHSANGEWQVRVVPNKYPAVTLTGDDEPVGETARLGLIPAAEAASPPANAIAPGLGVHEVIVETPRHIDRTSALSTTELRDVLNTYALRLRHWRALGRFAYGLVFKNQGRRAGASLAHLHSQFIALPTVPPAVAAELRRAEMEYRRDRNCPYCRLIQNERLRGERVIYDDNGFIAFCPFASLQPYEVWLMPTDHQGSFDELAPDALDRLAEALHAVAGRAESVVADGAFNLMLRTAPWRVPCGDWSHWRIELLPRAAALAGFELASGMFINPVAPERAASKLRSI